MPQPLVAAAWRPAALVAAALGTALVTLLAVITYHSAGTSFDDWATRTAYHHIGAPVGYQLLDLSRPATVVAALTVVGIGAAALHRWDIAVLTAVAPAIAVVVTEELLKPVLDRPLGSLRGSFPSGHETAVAAAAVVLLLIAGQVRLPRGAQVGITVLLVAWTAVAAVGLVRNFYHYATDTIAAVGVAVAVVLATALGIDLVSARAGRSPARTARAT